MSTASPSSIIINGTAVDVSGVPVHHSILDFLRSSGRTGSKIGCNEGDCGACTILLLENQGPPRAINGCLALVASLVGREIITAEGLSQNGTLHPVQQSMVDCNGSQCGYCTPGFICSMAEAHARNITAPEAIADQLCGNLCRCTGYRPIRDAMFESLTKTTPVLYETRKLPSIPSSPNWFRPTSIREAITLKSENPLSPFVAGATELAVIMNKRHVRYDALISLDGVAELHAIEKTAGHWKIGAAAPLTDIEQALAGEYPAIDQVMRVFASRQIRHRATLGGNLVTASPIADTPPVLLALDASVILASLTAERIVPLVEFFTGYRQTVMRSDEIMTSILLPRGLAGRCEFFKVSKRREMDISTVSAAFRIATDAAGLVTEARLAYGGVAATPARALKTEAALVGKPLAAAPEILSLLATEFTPLTDLRGSAQYRQSLIRDLFQKFIASSSQFNNQQSTTVIPLQSPIPNPNSSSLPHESAIGHVTGQALYVEDTALRRGALKVWLVRSSHAHATINRLDCSKAVKFPGINAVLTAADIPGLNNTGPARHDEPLFATDHVQFHGQLITAVIGESEETCRLAAGLIEIDYTPLPPILGIRQAIAAGSYHTAPHFLVRGEIESALLESPHLLEGEFHIGGQDHFYLETQAAWAEPDGAGGVHVSSSTQHPSEVQTIIAEILDLPRNRVVIEAPRMGGGFGGKETQGNFIAAICALAATVTGKSVSLQLDRDHDMESTGKRHPFYAQYKVGYHSDGRLHAADIQLVSDGGWSLDLSLPVNDRALFHLDNAYYIPHVRFQGRVAKTNVTSHTAFRGFGGPQGMLVIEEILGRIASILKLPPEQVRERNFYHGSGGTNTTHYGQEVRGNRLQRIWDKLLAVSDYPTRRLQLAAWNQLHPHTKRGLAITPVKFGISFTLKHYNQAGSLVLIYADGSVQVNHGGTEMGQGLHTKILGIAMRELGLPSSSIRLMHTRTDKVPNTSAPAASSGSDLNGMAVADACHQLRTRLLPIAAELLTCAETDIFFADGQVGNSSGASIPFATLTSIAYTRRIPLSAAGFYATPDLEWDWAVGKGRPFFYYAFGAAVSEVEIDGYTGMSKVLRTDILHDVGDSLNPNIDRGQIEGGFVQGMGWLTSEELKWDENGRLLTHSASTYAIPAFSDAPADFRVHLLTEAHQPGTIHGSKAVGEPPLMLAISVREAIRDALHAFDIPGDFILPSPCTGEAVKNLIRN